MFLPQWDAFSIPELENFLKILNREEVEYKEQIRAKYNLMHVHIIKRLEELDKQRQKATSSRHKQSNNAASDNTRYIDGAKRDGAKSSPDLHLNAKTAVDGSPVQSSRTTGGGGGNKEKSPPADRFGDDEREPIFV